MPSCSDEIYSQPLITGSSLDSHNYTITINGKKLSGGGDQSVSIISLGTDNSSIESSMSGKSSVRSSQESTGKSSRSGILTKWFSSRVKQKHNIPVESESAPHPTVIRIDSTQSSSPNQQSADITELVSATEVRSTTDLTDSQGPSVTAAEETETTTTAQIPSYDSVLRSDAQRFIDQHFRVPPPLPPPMFHLPMPFPHHLGPPVRPHLPVGILRRPGNPRRIRQANITQCATSPNVELTRWNFTPEFDANQPSMPNPSATREPMHLRDREIRTGNNILSPENLAPLMHGWGLPPPFLIGESGIEAREPEPKGCCGRPISHTTMIRWFIGVISVIGLCCVIVGIVLGALTVSGSTRLTLCLLMIGVGVVLIIVSGVAWRLTALDHQASPSCWSIFGFRTSSIGSIFPDRRTNVPSGRRGRPNGIFPPINFLLPDFPWRPPPPSYQATVQEHRVQQFLNNRNSRTTIGSPPPTYRSARPEIPCRILVDQLADALSGPPSYRSHLSPSTPVHRCHPTTTPEMENSQSSSLPANINNAAIVATEVVAVSDESDLLSGGHANETDEVPMPIYQEIDSIKDDVGTIVEVHQPTAKISVVDCSQVIPVGFEIENRSSPSHSRTNSSISASSSPEVRRMKCSTPTRNKTTVKPLRFRQKPNEVNQPNESNRDGTTLKSYRIANYANSGFTDGPGRDDQTLVSRIVLSDPINEPIFSPRPAVLTNEKAKSQVAVQTVRFEPDPTVSSRV